MRASPAVPARRSLGTNTRSSADTRAECCSPMRAARSECSLDRRKSRTMFVTEGVGFEPTVPQMGDNGFRDRADPAAMPHYNWSLHPGGMQGGMNLGRRVCATHRQRSATVLLASGAALSAANPGSPPTRECRNHAEATVSRATALTTTFMGKGHSRREPTAPLARLRETNRARTRSYDLACRRDYGGHHRSVRDHAPLSTNAAHRLGAANGSFSGLVPRAAVATRSP
jgi:hypothetical protein